MKKRSSRDSLPVAEVNQHRCMIRGVSDTSIDSTKLLSLYSKIMQAKIIQRLHPLLQVKYCRAHPHSGSSLQEELRWL